MGLDVGVGALWVKLWGREWGGSRWSVAVRQEEFSVRKRGIQLSFAVQIKSGRKMLVEDIMARYKAFVLGV